jgi:CheY-like chemotaxis protein
MKRRLLFVEDDDDIRDAFADLLRFAGWEVVQARDGEEALVLLARERPSAIVIDLKMPVLDGYEFRRRQLADPRLAAVPTVVFTADTDAGVESELFAGVPIVRKSQEFPELLAAIERAAS